MNCILREYTKYHCVCEKKKGSGNTLRIHLACKALRAPFIYLQHTIHADCKNNASCSRLKVFSSSLGMALLTVFRNHNSDKTKQFPVWLAKKNIAHAFLLFVHFIKDLCYKSEFLNGSAIRTRNLSKQLLPLQSEILTTEILCLFLWLQSGKSLCDCVQ